MIFAVDLKNYFYIRVYIN